MTTIGLALFLIAGLMLAAGATRAERPGHVSVNVVVVVKNLNNACVRAPPFG